MNEEYETKYFCNSSEVRPAVFFLSEQICFNLFAGSLLDVICCNAISPNIYTSVVAWSVTY